MDLDLFLPLYQSRVRPSYELHEIKKTAIDDPEGAAESSSTSSSQSFQDSDDEPVVAEPVPSYLPVATTSTEPQYNNQYLVEEAFDQGFYNYGTSDHTANDVTVPSHHLSHGTIQSYYMNMGINILPG